MAELLAVEEGETGTRRRLMIELAATAKSLSLGMDGGMEGWRGRFGEDADRVMGWNCYLCMHTYTHTYIHTCAVCIPCTPRWELRCDACLNVYGLVHVTMSIVALLVSDV